MLINFGGIERASTVDYPGKLAYVIFLRGCHVKCPRCHNKQLQSGENFININKIYKLIDNISPIFYDAIIISGGEPLEQLEGLIELAKYIRSKGFFVGLHTSGEGELYKCIEYFDYILLNTNRS